MTWKNSDGLTLTFGTESPGPNLVGEYRLPGPKRMIEIKFDYTNLPTVAASTTVISRLNALPKNCTIEQVEIYVTSALTSTSNDITISVGTIDLDSASNGASTSIVNAATAANFTTGGTNGSWKGSLVNAQTALTGPKLLTWTVANHAATAGHGAIRISYSEL